MSATGEPVATLTALAPIVHAGAVAAHGWVLDPLAQGVYTAAGFARHVPGDVLDVRTQMFVHAIEGGGDTPSIEPAGMKQLSIKAPFTAASGRVEWMWVDVTRWTVDTLEGTLANAPDFVKQLKEGAQVKVSFANVADFIHVMPDGTRTGGYSIEVFQKRGLVPSSD